MYSLRKGFSLIELVFVIVIIGILSAIAIPKLAATRDDAVISRAIGDIAAIRSAISLERQKRFLRGNFSSIVSLNGTTSPTGNGVPIFDFFDNQNSDRVLEYALTTCASASDRGCWIGIGGNEYTFRLPGSSDNVDFNITNNRFVCKQPTSDNCKLLTK